MAKFATVKIPTLFQTDPVSGIGIKICAKSGTACLLARTSGKPKQPQLGPFRKVVDAEALKDARPDIVEPFDVYVGIPTVEAPNLLPPQGFGQVGMVTVTT